VKRHCALADTRSAANSASVLRDPVLPACPGCGVSTALWRGHRERRRHPSASGRLHSRLHSEQGMSGAGIAELRALRACKLAHARDLVDPHGKRRVGANGRLH
jgi:hypothetical protein